MRWIKKAASLLFICSTAITLLVPTALADEYESAVSFLNFPTPAPGYALVSQSDYMVFENETFLSEYDVYELDSRGNVTKRLKYYEGDESAPITSVYTYDTAGDRLRTVVSEDSILTLTYNSAGDVTRGELIDSSGDVLVDEYEYDSYHNVAQTKSYTVANGAVVQDSIQTVSYTNEYDSNSRLVKRYTTDYPNSPTLYEYDWAGNRTKASTYIDGKLEGYTIYTYEKLGEISPIVTRIFADINQTWYTDAVEFVYENGLMSGTSPRAFEPDSNLTRAMFAQILYKSAGSPAVAETSQFSDVEPGQWYAQAVAWAAQEKIVTGYLDGNFGPSDPITREQLTGMLYRAAGSPDISSDEVYFSDASDISDWAVHALKWAAYNGIITGTLQDDNTITLAPQGIATRSQAAFMMMKYGQRT